jgi:hypothetical protein
MINFHGCNILRHLLVQWNWEKKKKAQNSNPIPDGISTRKM